MLNTLQQGLGAPLGHRLQGSGVGGGVLSPVAVRDILTYTTH